MLHHKQIDRICCAVLALTLLLTCGFMSAAANGLIQGERALGYETRLFDQSTVHTIDIVMDGWDEFLATCTSEEYTACTVVIDGEKYGNVAIRAKGNTSLTQVSAYGNDRYSFKIEFDHYQSGLSYHGLDKLSLNNLIQDKTYMKDYLSYTLMGKMGVPSPLCSFAQIRVNGEDWGLYLAVEAVEYGFLTRNYGAAHGELYKPDSLSFGGGRGNGRDFDMDEFRERWNGEAGAANQANEANEANALNDAQQGDFDPAQGGFDPTQQSGFDPTQGGFDPSQGGFDAQQGGFDPTQQGDFDPAQMFGEGGFGGGGGMGSADVMLQYIDDDPDSYSNIFDNAKTDVSKADQARLIASLKTLSEGGKIESVVDVEEVIRYLVVHGFLVNDDSYTGSMIHNYYLYEQDGKLSMLPWDYNLAFGAFSMGGGFGSGDGATSAVNRAIDTPVSSGELSSRPIISWIFDSEEYVALYHEIYQEFITTLLDSGWLDGEIARVQEMIAPYVQNDATAFYTYDQFTTACDALREFCSLRARGISGQLDGSIPSTTAGQQADSSALIDASHLSLDDMGDFNGGGNGKGSFGQPSMGGMMGGMPEGMMGRMPNDMPAGAPDEAQAASANAQAKPADMQGEPSDAQSEPATQPASGDAQAETGNTQGKPDSAQNVSSDMQANQPADMPSDKTARRSEGRGMNGKMDIPSMDFPESSGGNSVNLLWLAGCAVMLLAAILFAKFFRSGR